MSAALILQHGETGPPGVLGDWATARGIAFTVHRSDRDEPLPELDGQAFVASLGSPHNPTDTHVPYVADELRLLARAVERGVPVLGLCFGGQMLASALGGSIEPAPEPELGWYRFDSSAPDVVPEGPWLQWHYDRFTLPPGATELARSPVGLQAFEWGPHLGLQFHPESTIEIVRNWAHKDRERVREHGVEDPDALLDAGREHGDAAAAAARTLFDAFWERAGR